MYRNSAKCDDSEYATLELDPHFLYSVYSHFTERDQATESGPVLHDVR